MTLSETDRMIGPYELLDEIGRGGMSCVYQAFDSAHDREVALKLLTSTITNDEEFQRRFQREASIVSKLEHRFILPVLDYGRDENKLFLVMPLVPYGTLSDQVRAGGVYTPAQAAEIAQQIGEALDYAHSQQIIHRDVKPHNIMVMDEHHYCLADFGVMKLDNESTQLTFSGILVGSPAYMSPEQASSRKVDHRTDVYALGIVLYESLLGRRPFAGETPIELITQRLTTQPIAPTRVNPAFPTPLERVLLKALQLDPERRYTSAGELAAAFSRAVASMPEAAQHQPLVTPELLRASLTLVNEPLTVQPRSAGSSLRQVLPWAVTAAAIAALALVIFVVQGMVVRPLQAENAAFAATANALRATPKAVREEATPVVIVEPTVIYVTVIATPQAVYEPPSTRSRAGLVQQVGTPLPALPNELDSRPAQMSIGGTVRAGSSAAHGHNIEASDGSMERSASKNRK